MKDEKSKRLEIIEVLVDMYFVAKNGLPPMPKTALEVEARKHVAKESYQNDCLCHHAVNKAYALIMEALDE